MEPHPQPSLDPRAVREQLDRIVSSRHFARSQRLRRFLHFTVEHVLAGTSDQVKEFLVGAVVFDRRHDYDPRVDPIVRVEARRLRKRLEAYYANEGAADTLEIVIPTGSYVPEIRQRSARAVNPPAAPAPCTALAVLPFASLAPEADDQYFSDGLAEELLRLLAAVRGLRVVAFHSAAQLRGREQDYRAIHEQLGVDRILRGSVRRAGDRIRVTAHLVDATDGSSQWSDIFEGEIADVFALQERIARGIVDALKLTLELPDAPRPQSPAFSESYHLCLMGRFELNRRTPDGMRKALTHFERAAALDPSNSMAHAQMAATWTLLCEHAVLPPRDVMHRAKAAALRALTLDPNSADAHTSLGLLSGLLEWNWCEAEALLRRALDLNPNHAEAHLWFGCDILGTLGRMDEAREHVHLALHLDPLSVAIRTSQGYFSILAGDYEAALSSHRQSIALMPDAATGYSGAGRALGLLGRHEEAVAHFRRARQIAPDVPSIVGAMGQVLGEAGREAEARECLAELHTMAQTRFVPSTTFGVVHIGLGEIAQALDYAEQGCRNREASISKLKVHPIFARIRHEPRALRLLSRMGL